MRTALAAGALLVAAACAQEEGSEQAAPLDRARAALAEGDALGARVALEEAIGQGTPHSQVAAYLGEAALMAGDLAEARRWLATGDFAPPTRVLGFRMLGRLEMAEGDLAAAGAAFDAALQTDSRDPELWVDIGRLRHRAGEQVRAFAAADRALAFGPANPRALQFRGQLIRDAQGLPAAAAWFAQAVARVPGDSALRADYAATLGDAGRAAEALTVLRSVPDESSSAPRTLYIQAVIAARGGRFDLARLLLQRTDDATANTPAAQMLSAVIDVERGNYESAAQTLVRLHDSQPDNRQVGELLAYALSRSGGEVELVHRFAASARQPVGSPYLRLLVGRAHEVLGDREAAAVFLDLAARPDPGLAVLPPAGPPPYLDEPGAPTGLAARDAIRAALETGDARQARRIADRFVGIYPGSGDALALLGDAELSAGDEAAARQAYAEAAAIRGSWPLVLRRMAAVETPAEAAQLLSRYLAAHPADAAAAAQLADALAAGGRWNRAAALLDFSLANGLERVPWVHAARSVAARELGQPDLALTHALRAYELQRTHPAAIAALIAALPPEESEARADLVAKLAAYTR